MNLYFLQSNIWEKIPVNKQKYYFTSHIKPAIHTRPPVYDDDDDNKLTIKIFANVYKCHGSVNAKQTI